MEITAKDIGIKSSAAEPDGQINQKDADKVKYWLRQVSSATKTEKEWRKSARHIVSIYEGDRKEDYQYNILYSNTDTLQPALYNSTPRPVVQRRFKDADPTGKLAAKVGERLLAFLMDTGNPEYTSFDDFMKSATLESLVPGRGVTRFKYDATIEEAQSLAQAESGGDSAEEEPEDGEPEAAPPSIEYETVCGEEVPWDRFNHGPSKKWQQVPWVSFDHYMDREELEKNFGALGAKVPVSEMLADGDNEDDEQKQKKEAESGMKVAKVIEIWDKTSRTVIFVSPQWPNAPLRQVEDPLKLQGFFPCPRPLMFMQKISTLTPVPLYQMYQAQAKELNTITVRINQIIKALKVRGFYDQTIEGMDKIMAADDNVLVPVENVAALFSQGGSLEKSIFLMPIEKLVAVLQQLYLQRTQIKAVIFEITGIADIMRGSSQASETLGAQQIKNQWGTLRLKKAQKEVMRYTRDCLRLILEIAVSKLAPETVKKMTGLPFPTAQEKQQAQMQLQQLQQQAQQQAALAQQSGQEASPLPEPPEELALAAKLPSWEELLGILQDDLQRNYRVDIETNSTIDAEATEDKEDVADIMNAISQFMNGIGPLVQDGTMPFAVAQKMLLAIVRRFRFGTELEDELNNMKAPEAKPDPKAAQAEAEVKMAQEAHQMDMQARQADLQGKSQMAQIEGQKMQQQSQLAQIQAQIDMQRLQAEAAQSARDAEYQAQAHAQRMAELALQAQLAQAQHQQKLAIARQKPAPINKS